VFPSTTATLERMLRGTGIELLVNEQKPRMGTFEVTLPSGNKVASLVGMAKPFSDLQQLDVRALADQILAEA
jgi:hypothetical protein